MMLMVDAWTVATRRTDGDTGSQTRNMAEALQVPGGPGATEHDESTRQQAKSTRAPDARSDTHTLSSVFG